MDSINQSANKRSFCDDANLLQNQDDIDVSVEEGEAGGQAKRFKQELHPLLIANVVEKIISYLDVDSVKSVREMSKLWSAEGAKFLISKCYVKIPSDLLPQVSSSKNMKLNQFKAFLSHKSSDHSMIPKITINSFGDFKRWKSLGVLGPQVKSVKLNFIDKKTEMLSELLDLLPNLKYLNLNGIGYKAEIIKFLVSLMGKDKKKDQKPLTISYLTLEPENMEQLEELDKFSDCNNIMLEELELIMNPGSSLNYFRARLINIMNKLLLENENILKTLILKNCDFYLSRLDFPCMTALTEVGLDFYSPTSTDRSDCKFSPSFRFSEKIPNLQSMSINCPSGYSFFKSLFVTAGKAPLVKKFKSCGRSSSVVIYTLFNFFPHIEEFHMDVNCGFPATFYSLWNLGENIKKLTLHFDLHQLEGGVASLDSIFSGFSPKYVDKIKNDPKLDAYTLMQFKELRANPSILNLKELKHLAIHFHRVPQHGLTDRMLAIAAEYAFRHLPKDTKIVIHVEDKSYQAALNGGFDPFGEISKLPAVSVKRF